MIAAVIPMTLTGGFFLYRLQLLSYDMAIASLEQKALRQKLEIDFFLHEKLKAVRFLAQNFDRFQFKDESFLAQKLQGLKQEYGPAFMSLELMDERGQQLAYAGNSIIVNSRPKEADWFQTVLDSQNVISDVFLDSMATPVLIVAVSIQEQDFRWILKADIDFSSIISRFSNFESQQTGTTFILNRKGEFQTPVPENLTTAAQHYLEYFNKGKISGIFENSEVLLAFATLKNNEWLLIARQDAGKAFSKLDFTRRIAAIIFVLCFSGIVLAAFLLAGKFRKRILQGDNSKAEVVAPDDIVNRQIIESGSLASIGELASGIAHEINNPVAIMIEEAGWVQDLLHEGIDKNDNREEFFRALKQIETQGRRCKEITQKLLSFGRKTDSRIQNVQLNELVEEVAALSSEKAKNSGVEIYTRLDPHLPEIQASITEMQQVLLNIVNNALDAMEHKGGRIDISSALTENQIVITIADNGPGIPAMIMNRLFDPFFSTKPVGKGTGLGLSICYGIIKKMGGKIDFESMLGEGSTFRILLPLNDHLE
ncbi:MAG: ATP-binding protein [Desulfobacterales bacterium]